MNFSIKKPESGLQDYRRNRKFSNLKNKFNVDILSALFKKRK